MTEAHNSSISSPTHNMFGKIMYLILSIRNLGKKKKRKYSNGSEVSYISEISYVSDDSYVSEDQVAIRESLRQSPTSLPAVQLNSNVGHFSFILFLSRFMHCLTIHQLAILSSIVVFVSKMTEIIVMKTAHFRYSMLYVHILQLTTMSVTRKRSIYLKMKLRRRLPIPTNNICR